MSERQKLTGAPLVIKKMVSTLESKKRFVNHSLLVANFEFFKMGSFRVVFSFQVMFACVLVFETQGIYIRNGKLGHISFWDSWWSWCFFGCCKGAYLCGSYAYRCWALPRALCEEWLFDWWSMAWCTLISFRKFCIFLTRICFPKQVERHSLLDFYWCDVVPLWGWLARSPWVSYGKFNGAWCSSWALVKASGSETSSSLG